jgi:hypothetical protein
MNMIGCWFSLYKPRNYARNKFFLALSATPCSPAMKYRKSPRQIAREASQALRAENNTAARIIPHEFVASVQGRVVFPWTEGYDTDRKEFDDLYPAFPVVIIYVACYQDVRECLALAQSANLQVAVRSGGHSLAGFSVCDGMVIDLSELHNIAIDVQGCALLWMPVAPLSDCFRIWNSTGCIWWAADVRQWPLRVI